MLKRFVFLAFYCGMMIAPVAPVLAQVPDEGYPLFDDQRMIEGYSAKLASASREMLLAMINDQALVAYRKAAAIMVFRARFAPLVVAAERGIVEKAFLRQLDLASSVFVQIELMHTLGVIDRYRYFDAMVPALILKIDHYDDVASVMAYKGVLDINASGNQRAREARIEFNTLRKIFFMSRKKLLAVDATDIRLRNKIDLLRSSIKVLGTDEIKNLPRELIGLM